MLFSLLDKEDGVFHNRDLLMKLLKATPDGDVVSKLFEGCVEWCPNLALVVLENGDSTSIIVAGIAKSCTLSRHASVAIGAVRSPGYSLRAFSRGCLCCQRALQRPVKILST